LSDFTENSRNYKRPRTTQSKGSMVRREQSHVRDQPIAPQIPIHHRDDVDMSDQNDSDDEKIDLNAVHEFSDFYLYKWLDVKDEINKWCEAQVVGLNKKKGTIKVHYKGWKAKFDEWLDPVKDASRLAKLHTHTDRPFPGLPDTFEFKKGRVVDMRDIIDKWYPAEIVDVKLKTKLVKVHYDGWGSKHDEWVSFDSYRLAPRGRYAMKRRKGRNIQTARGIVSTSKAYHSPNRATTKYKCIPILRQKSGHQATPQNEEYFRRQLEKEKGWTIVDTEEDGNCLFRAVADQVYGDQSVHEIIREKCCDYLESESEYFKQYVDTESIAYDRYLKFMRRSSTWGGNVEIQAISEIYDRPVEIYAYDVTPRNTFSNLNRNRTSKPPIRLSYHFNSHYNSIASVGHKKHTEDPEKAGEIEDRKIKFSQLRTIQALQQSTRISDFQATELSLLEQAMQESRQGFQVESYATLDKALSESLITAECEQEKDIEEKMLAIAIKESKASVIVTNSQPLQSDAKRDDDLPRPITALVAEGFDQEQVFLAWTIYGIENVPEEKVIQNMRIAMVSGAVGSSFPQP